MKRLPILVGIVLVSLVSSCKKEVIQPNDYYGVEQSREPAKINKIGGNSVGSPSSSGTLEGGITDPNDDDYSTRRPNKKISQ